MEEERRYPFCRAGLDIAGCHLSNRIFLPAHSYGFPSDDHGRQQMLAYVERRLRGGVGLVVVGEAECQAFGEPRGALPASRQAGEASRALYEGLGALAAATGTAIFEQLYSPGGQVWFDEMRPSRAPSKIPQAQSFVVPSELSAKELGELRKAFATAANVVVNSGLQGVELKADQGKLHHQFLSRAFNIRRDQYGGTMQNRMRWLIECLEEIRATIPTRAVLGIRLPGEVTPPTGCSPQLDWAHDLSFDECAEVVEELSSRKLVDYISISGESNSTAWGYLANHGGESVPNNTFRAVSRRLKKHTALPIFLSGKILSMNDAEELLSAGDCDAVGMARALIADAELIMKSVEAKSSSGPIRECLSCNLVCVQNTWNGRSVGCIYDPLCGRETEFSYVAGRSRRVAIIGGGPAGLEFARVAALLGSEISIYEKRDRLGGMLNLWKLLPGRRNLEKAVEFWTRDLERSNVHLNSEVDEKFDYEKFDYVVIATGASELVPDVPLGDGLVRNITAEQAISRQEDLTGKRIVLVEGNRFEDPLGVAVLLSDRGAEVIVVTPFAEIGLGNDLTSFSARFDRIEEKRISIIRLADVRAGAGGTIYVRHHSRNFISQIDGVSYIVWCVNPIPSGSFGWPSGKIVRVGDAVWPRGLERTVKEAHDLAVAFLGAS